MIRLKLLSLILLGLVPIKNVLGQVFPEGLTGFSKIKNYNVIFSEEKQDQIDFPVSDIELAGIAGKKTYIHFGFDETTEATVPSPQQIIRSHLHMIEKSNGKLLFEAATYATFKLYSNHKTYWIALEIHEQGESYVLAFVSTIEHQEQIKASSLLYALNKQGHVPIYFNFSSNSSQISQESEKFIQEIIFLLKLAPKLIISIEGHTDNEGIALDNKSLSLERAKAVRDKLILLGVASERLQVVGWGQEKPLKDNSTEEGRSKNRRVELVKK